MIRQQTRRPRLNNNHVPESKISMYKIRGAQAAKRAFCKLGGADSQINNRHNRALALWDQGGAVMRFFGGMQS